MSTGEINWGIATQKPAVEVLPPDVPEVLLSYTSLSVITDFINEADALAEEVKTYPEINDSNFEKSKNLSEQLKAFNHTLEDRRKKYKKPYLEKGKQIDAFFGDLRSKITNAIINLKNAQLPYLNQKEKERRAKEREAKKEAERRQQEVDAQRKVEQEAVRAVVKEDVLRQGYGEAEAKRLAEQAVEQMQPSPTMVYSVPGKTEGLREKEVWEIADFKALPDECFRERSKQVKAAVAPWINAQQKAGITNIPGVVFKTIAEVKI